MNKFELKSADGSLEENGSVQTRDVTDEQLVSKATWRNWMLGPIAFLYMCGMNMSLFIVGQYIYRRIQMEEYPNKTFATGVSFCSLNRSDPDVYRLSHVQKTASWYNLVFSVVAGVPSIVINILFGSYTDRFGRKFLMIVAMTGTLLRVLISVIGVYSAMNLNLFAIAFIVEGFAGQAFAFLLASYAYACDSTNKKHRALGIVFVEVFIGLGTTISAFAAGYFLQAEGFLSPLYVSAAIIVLAILLTVFVLPESFPKEKRLKQTETCMNFRHALGFYFSPSNAGRRWKYNVAIIVFFLVMIDVLGRGNVETLFQMNAPFCWNPQKLGLFGALRMGLQQVAGMIMVTVLKTRLADDSIAIIGSISYAAGFIIEAFAKTDTVVYIVTAVGSLGLLTVPLIRSIMSQMTSTEKQGALAASISAVETLCNFTANIIANSIYMQTVNTFGGAVFLAMSGFSILSLVLLIILKCGSRGDYDDTKEEGRASSVRPISYYEKDRL